MFCPECSKLAVLNTKKICVRCQGLIVDNLSCICDKCSREQNMCSICLKKLHIVNGQNVNPIRRGCSACGKKLK
jgi:hypothetical protein